ncbi:EVE domain-containing protein [Arsenicitalea aurantiaca]|uniref:EVE domain-containing protein n=1 Tax=Arsenicitalea aurantiaca TaxID=1783274 RepID=A0A433X5J1_9HYPH|nr:EVE domain-containing protein [Arsenicitalea aurantiaca]RUT29345.1 EVE domain-containing protein [Arsenicitalea aurantiaca]
MAHWLFKSEPDTWGWHDQVAKKGPEEWHGVRNYQARNNMRLMQVGELGFFYHSVKEKAVVGIVRVATPIHPDSTAEPKNGKIVWECVDIEAVRSFERPVTLDEIKVEPGLEQMVLVNNSRLSVQPVSEAEWAIICRMGGVEP